MSDFILINGDMVNFQSAFGAANVIVKPGKITGSGPPSIDNKKICIEGDESSVSVPGCQYTAGQYSSVPGVGTLKIQSLAGDQKSKKMKIKGKAVLLKGSQFNAIFEVQSPALAPPKGAAPPEPDTSPSYSGKGSFTTSNSKFKSK